MRPRVGCRLASNVYMYFVQLYTLGICTPYIRGFGLYGTRCRVHFSTFVESSVSCIHTSILFIYLTCWAAAAALEGARLLCWTTASFSTAVASSSILPALLLLPPSRSAMEWKALTMAAEGDRRTASQSTPAFAPSPPPGLASSKKATQHRSTTRTIPGQGRERDARHISHAAIMPHTIYSPIAVVDVVVVGCVAAGRTMTSHSAGSKGCM